MSFIYTIGFTKTSAQDFFGRLIKAKVKNLIDVRLNNTSQLAGFAKAKDLAFFLDSIARIKYFHEPMLAPTQDMLDQFKKDGGSWSLYETKFLDLMDKRHIEERLSPDFFQDGCLLCSEDKPHHCHRRLVAEYLNNKWGSVLKIQHL